MSNPNDFVIKNGVLIKYHGPGGDVVVPEGVTEIDRRAFYGNGELNEIVISEGVATIGSMAFEECSGLVSVTLPESLTSIGAAAFRGCRALKRMILPAGCSSIGDNAFAFCEAMSEIQLPSSLKKVGNGFLSNCKSLRTCSLPNKVKTIGDHSLWPCAFEMLTIYGSPKISLMAFGRTQKDSSEKAPPIWCPNMQLSDIPKPYVNAALKGFVLAFCMNDSGIAERKPEYIKWLKTQKGKLMDRIAREESWLSLFLTEKILSKEEAAALLEKKKDQLSVTSTSHLIEYIRGDMSLSTLELSPEEKPVSMTALKKTWTWKDCKDGTVSISSYKGDSDEVVVPSTIGGKVVSEIGEYAFSIDAPRVPNSFVRRNIQRIVLPEGVKTLGTDAFEGCKSLVNILLPKSLTTIGAGAFAVCESLVSISVPDGLTLIGKSAFKRCPLLQEVSLPRTVQRIEPQCFEDCPNLTIHAPAGSYAEQYAKEHNIPFVAE